MPEDDESGRAGAGRPVWSGTLSFGLVSVPVILLPANRPKRVSMRMVGPGGRPLQRRYFTSGTNRKLPPDQIVRGYEVEDDRFVVLTDDELERLAPDRSRNIDVRLFVDEADLDPRYFERGYFLAPAGGSSDAYRLLATVMEESGRAGIATFVMRSKEYLTAILAENGMLRVETLRFVDEVRTPKDVGLPKPARPKPAEVRSMTTQIRKRLKDRISRKEMVDPVAERTLELVRKKARRGDDVVEVPADAGDTTGVVDLVAILQERLDAADRAAPTRATDSVRLDASTKAQLYERARELDVEGRSRMSKAQLIEAIRRAG